ncbi:hypothetical protein ACWZEH_09425 [Streptomyces sp. QTS137]
MGWSFRVHGGVAAGLGAVLLVLAGLTWLPGALPLAGVRWLPMVLVVVLFPVFVAAVARLLLRRADKGLVWQAFRCLPGKVQVGLLALALSGFAMTAFGYEPEGNLQSAEVRDGRYFAFDTTPHARGTVEISQEQYRAVHEADQRSLLAVPGLLFVGAAYVVLAAGELHRADLGIQGAGKREDVRSRGRSAPSAANAGRAR